MELNGINNNTDTKSAAIEGQEALISVIIPTYNRAHLLGRSIQSVLAQTYGNLELLIIDDCSGDNTGEFVKGLSDERIRYYRNEQNMGPAASKNKGISLAKGEFLAFQDDDDVWKPEKLARLMEVWKREGNEETGMIYHEMQEKESAEFIPPRELPLEWKSGEIFRYMLLYPIVGGAASLIRKTYMDELGGFCENLGSIEDYEFYLRMAKKYRILFVGEPLMIIYDTPGSVNKRFKSKIDTELYILDTMYDSLCQYGILQEKVNLIRQQAENYDCEDYFYEQALQLCERLEEKDSVNKSRKNGDADGNTATVDREQESGSKTGGIRDSRKDDGNKPQYIRECISRAAKDISRAGNGDKAAYYQNAAGQIQRVVEGLARLQGNLKKNPAVLSGNRTAVVSALSDIIKDLEDYTDLALHPIPQKERLEELLGKLTAGQKSNEIVRAVLNDTLKEAEKLLSQIGKAKCLCTACGNEVRFLPPSPYKRVMREHYGYKGTGIEFLFEGEAGRCPVCGAPENIRFLLGFLEDIQPEGEERLKICCLEAPDDKEGGIQEWVRKYASAKEYMEYVPSQDNENLAGKIDVIVCVDILEQAADASGIPGKIRKLLEENGICIIMTSAFLKEVSSDFIGNIGGNADRTESLKKFGLEGVRRIYTERDMAAEFEKAGFNVGVADVNWFGEDYYEKCGFEEKAKMFMLTIGA